METSLMNLLCSTPSCRIQPGPSSSQGKAAGGSSFSSILHGSLNRGHGTTFYGSTVPEITPPAKSPASDDALSRSLDVIDALAYLPVLLAAQSQVNSAQADIGNALFSSDDVGSLLDAIANALETGDTEGLRKTLEENKSLQDILSKQEAGASWLLPGETQDSSGPGANTGQGWDSVSNAIASLIAALDAANGGTSAESPQSARNYGMAEDQASRDGDHTAPGEGSGKEGAQNASNAAGDSDAAANTMFLGVVLPNLVAAKPDTAAEDSTPAETSSTQISSGSGSFLAQEKAYQGAGIKANGASSRTVSSKGNGQPSGTNSLSEDHALPGEAKTDRASDTVEPGKLFEVLYARAQDGSGTGKDTGEASATLNGNIKGEQHNTVAPGDIPAGQAARAPEKQIEAEKTGSAAGKTVLTEETVFADLKNRKEKSSHSDESASPSDTNEKANVLIHDSAKATTSSQKSSQTGQAAASQASAMVHKIEELAESYSSKSQSMDMVLRLKVDEKESLVVGLRSQGDRVFVDVKGASDGLLSALQSQKDLITRELESKQIYTTINVEINGDGNPNGQNRRQQHDRSGKEDNETDFGGIFNTLT